VPEDPRQRDKWWVEASASSDQQPNPVEPRHYKRGKYECVEIIEDLSLGYHLGNAMKYLWRAGHKGEYVEDLRKSVWYIQRAIDLAESAAKVGHA